MKPVPALKNMPVRAATPLVYNGLGRVDDEQDGEQHFIDLDLTKDSASLGNSPMPRMPAVDAPAPPAEEDGDHSVEEEDEEPPRMQRRQVAETS